MKLVQFDKKLGLAASVSITVGAVIGVGIFVIVGPMGANSGSWMPLAFAIAALPAIFGTLVSCALGSTIPTDAGGFFYTRQLLGRYAGTAASALVILGAIGAMMTVSMGVADYMALYFPGLPRFLVASSLILISWLVNWVGVMASAKFQIIAVVQLASGILLVIIASLLGGGSPDFSQPLPHGMPGFMQACVIAMLTYTGFNIVGEMGDEIKNPRRNVPLTIAFGLGIIIILYTGIGWVVSGTLTVAEMKTSKVAVLDTAFHYLPAWTAHYINLAAFAAAITSVNAVFLVVPRELMALSGEKMIPAWLAGYNPKRQSFPAAMALISALGCGMTFFNLNPDVWGMFCVAGLMAANALFSIGTLRLFAVFPAQVNSSPLPIKKWWVYPSAVLSALFSAGFAGMALYFYKPLALVAAILLPGALYLCFRSGRLGRELDLGPERLE